MPVDDGLEPLPASLARTWGNTETMEGRMMEGSVQGSTSQVVTEWKIRVCDQCGRRVSPYCDQHPDAFFMHVTVVPKYPEWFIAELTGDDSRIGLPSDV